MFEFVWGLFCGVGECDVPVCSAGPSLAIRIGIDDLGVGDAEESASE